MLNTKKEDKNKKQDDQYDHLIKYPNGLEWEQIGTSFSMPDLYRYATIEDESLVHEKGEKKAPNLVCYSLQHLWLIGALVT